MIELIYKQRPSYSYFRNGKDVPSTLTVILASRACTLSEESSLTLDYDNFKGTEIQL